MLIKDMNLDWSLKNTVHFRALRTLVLLFVLIAFY